MKSRELANFDRVVEDVLGTMPKELRTWEHKYTCDNCSKEIKYGDKCKECGHEWSKFR
jgi:hypothetical protein